MYALSHGTNQEIPTFDAGVVTHAVLRARISGRGPDRRVLRLRWHRGGRCRHGKNPLLPVSHRRSRGLRHECRPKDLVRASDARHVRRFPAWRRQLEGIRMPDKESAEKDAQDAITALVAGQTE